MGLDVLIHAPVVVPHGAELDEPDDVGLVLALGPQLWVDALVGVGDAAGQVVVGGGVGHVLEHQAVEFKAELVAVTPAVAGAGAHPVVLPGLLHELEGLLDGALVHQVLADFKYIGVRTGTGDVVAGGLIRLQVGEVDDAAGDSAVPFPAVGRFHGAGVGHFLGLSVDDLEGRTAGDVGRGGPLAAADVIAQLVDDDRRVGIAAGAGGVHIIGRCVGLHNFNGVGIGCAVAGQAHGNGQGGAVGGRHGAQLHPAALVLVGVQAEPPVAVLAADAEAQGRSGLPVLSGGIPVVEAEIAGLGGIIRPGGHGGGVLGALDGGAVLTQGVGVGPGAAGGE